MMAPSPERHGTGPGPLLEVDDLRLWFRTPIGMVRAVDGVSLSLDRGRTLGIVGESGSGKTVLSRGIMGILPSEATVRPTGSVLFDGKELLAMDPEDLRKLWGIEMSMVFQDPMTSLNPVKRIDTQITESLRHHFGMSRSEANQHAVDALRSVGIPEPERRVRQYPHQLSGGMRQRVTIVIALACSPRLLFADEPTTALDVTVQAQILDLLATQQSSRDMAMILVTHDLGVVSGRTDDIIVMYGGQVVERAPTDVLFREMQMPYTEALLNATPKLSGPIHARLQAIPGRPPDLVNPPRGCRFAARCPYAQERCLHDEPPLVAGSVPSHEYRCWYPLGTDAGREAWERNQAAGKSAAGTPVTVGEEVV
ncbi:MAG: ABC transporter ATP-binding protein [Actinomycetota bacterium]